MSECTIACGAGQEKTMAAAIRLQATRCRRCGRTLFPAKRVCLSCYTDEGIEPVALSLSGKVYSFTIQRMMTPKWGTEPLVVCYVDLEDSGVRLFGRLECLPEEVKIGMLVELVIDDREPASDDFVFYHFQPAATSNEN